jgi:hypothetical protein
METIDMEQRLWEYIDGISTADERSVVETLIRDNAEWRALYQELLQVNQSLADIDLEQPSLRFTKNVMEEIAKYHIAPATKTYINNKIIWGIAAFFVLSIVGFLIYGIGQIDWSVSANSNSPLSIDLSKLDYGKMFNSSVMNIFMMVNAVLGLMLLDRYFGNKRKKLYETA